MRDWMNINTIIETLFCNDKMTEEMYVTKQDLHRYMSDYATVLHQPIEFFDLETYYANLLNNLQTLGSYSLKQQEMQNQCSGNNKSLLTQFLAKQGDTLVLKYKPNSLIDHKDYYDDVIDEYTSYFIENCLTCNQKVAGHDNMGFANYMIKETAKNNSKTNGHALVKRIS